MLGTFYFGWSSSDGIRLLSRLRRSKAVCVSGRRDRDLTQVPVVCWPAAGRLVEGGVWSGGIATMGRACLSFVRCVRASAAGKCVACVLVLGFSANMRRA